MKKIYFKSFITALLLLCSTVASAYDFEVDGIYYNITDATAKTVAVTYKGEYYYQYPYRYIGAITIPSTVTYNGTTHSVTSIGGSAFEGCSGLTSITIPNSVTSIGGSAFEGCSGLTSITIPNSVTSIGYGAFEDCTGLTSITIPNSVTSIGENAFYYCEGLTSVTFGNSVTIIGYSAFYGTAWYNNLPNGIVYAGKVLYTYIGTMPANTSITIKEGTLGIASYAFSSCKGLTSITIPNSVTSIGYGAFEDCTGLTSVTIPNSVTSIGDWAFAGCTGLTSITIPNSVTSIGDHAFNSCNGLTSVTIPNSVTSIGDYAFEDCDIKKVIWLTNTPPTGYSNISAEVHYVSNDLYRNLNKVKVYPYLSSIFTVDGVKYVPVNPSQRTCDAIDCLHDNSAEKIIVGKTVKYKNIEMTVNKLMPYAFYGNKYIKNATISNNGDIGDSAFRGCTSLATVSINNKDSIGDYAFYGCSSLKEVVLPDSVTSLGNYSFQSCSALESVVIGNGITSIGSYAFAGNSLLNNIILGGNLATIRSYAFSGCCALPEIIIPQSTTTISNYAFKGCSSLADIIIEDRKTSISLGSNGSSALFADCPLDSVYIGGRITYPTSSSNGYSPFYNNKYLRTVVITNEETEIYDNEFYNCTNLSKIVIGNGVEKIGNWAFSHCTNLNYFAFGRNMKTIGEEAFSDCNNLTTIISLATTPPVCGSQALDDINKWECVLYVPGNYISTYQTAEQWKDFFFIENAPISFTADVDGDGSIDVADVTEVVDAILNGEGENENTPFEIIFDAWTSTNTAHSSTSQNSYTLEVTEGSVLTFDWEVSSENNYDWLIITLDGTQILKKSGSYSGSYEHTFNTAGTHTLVVEYTKDSSSSSGSDQGKIHNIKLTGTANDTTDVNADVDGDGSIDIADVTALVEIILGTK